jgi:Family of unknown function (DUF6504)
VSRRHSEPIGVTVDQAGQPRCFTWRRRTYSVEIIGCWHLADKWWDADERSDRQYYRLMTKDLRIFVLYKEITPGKTPYWVLDTVQD